MKAMKNVPADNPHMWIPNHVRLPNGELVPGPEQFDEVCHLCGVFSGAHHRQPDPPEAALPCPEPWPEDDLTDQEFAALEAEAEKQDRADGKGALYDHQARRK